MSRVILIQTAAKKGAAHRALRAEIDRVKEELTEIEIPAGMLRALGAAHVGVNKLISAAGRSDVLDIQIQISETPTGGWQSSLIVDVPTPTFQAPANG
ncbi:MAG TPA: hypothetical protein VFI91_01525 [Longimicrobiaceae bacterium]|nr:hypothetical protein [Longimicrobiaceae bacterium]